MSRQQTDANSAALHAGAALPGRAVDVVVLSNDDALLLTLQDAAGVEHAVWHAPSADAAVELLVSGRCGVLLVDLQALHSDAAALFERLQAQFPELALLATGARKEEGAIGTLISSGCVYRFLHKPVSPARANQFLGAAVRRHYELAAHTSLAMTTIKQLARPSNRNPLLGAAAVVVVLALAAAWLFSRPAAPPASWRVIEESAPAPAAAPEADPQTVDMLAVQVAQALQASDVPAAARALTALQAAKPGHPQLESLREQLLALSRAVSAKAPAAKGKAVAKQARTPNIDLVRARIASKEFVEPADDSALFYLRQARLMEEDETASQILAADLGTRLLDQVRRAIAADDAPQAQRWLAAARDIDREFGLALPDLPAVTKELSDFVAAEASPSAGEPADASAASQGATTEHERR